MSAFFKNISGFLFLGLYRLVFFLLLPFIILFFIVRIFKGKEDRSRLFEKFGISSKKRPPGDLYWFHGASLGELNSAKPLMDSLLQQDPSCYILVTAGTQAAAKIYNQKEEERIIHQFFPLDFYLFSHFFLKRWDPTAIFWIEADIWPSFLNHISALKIPLFFLNARIDLSVFQKWGLFSPLLSKTLQGFSHIFSQSASITNHLKKELQGHPSLSTANLKYAVTLPKLKTPPLSEGCPTWVASNIHEEEAGEILKAHTLLSKEFPSLCTILVPRHFHWIERYEEKLKEKNIKFQRRSQKSPSKLFPGIYIGDTMGEMSYYYDLSDIIFMGGSLKKEIGGHNLLEPASLSKAILSGPYMGKNSEIQHYFRENGALITTRSAEEIKTSVKELLHTPERLKKLKKNSEKIFSEYENILKEVLQIIWKKVKPHV